MYNKNQILFGNYNNHLVSRIHSKSIFQDIYNEIDFESPLILDFKNVSVVTLSFATELFSNFKNSSIQFVIQNANPFVLEVLDFANFSIGNKELCN